MTLLVELTDYDPSWPSKFEQESSAIADAISQWLIGPIEHIGSTAIPGLRAKPIIDIMAPVESLSASGDALPVLTTLQYEYWPYRADVMQWLCKPSDEFRTIRPSHRPAVVQFLSQPDDPRLDRKHELHLAEG